MRLIVTSVAFGLCLQAAPAMADQGRLQVAIADGVSACSNWVLTPVSWVDDVGAFPLKAGLADKLVPIGGPPERVFPPEVMESATQFYRLDAGDGNGVFIASSANVPVCHVAAGGPSDFQPAAEALVQTFSEAGHWHDVKHDVSDEMVTDTFRNTRDGKATLLISRAPKPNDRTDRVQFFASVLYELRK